MEKNKQEKIIEMINDFSKLTRENQVYVSGIVKGMYLQKEAINKEQQSA